VSIYKHSVSIFGQKLIGNYRINATVMGSKSAKDGEADGEPEEAAEEVEEDDADE
jgi:hypothetical protein